MSSARPKIAAYPFTTLEPIIGMVSLGYEDFAAVDIPGLIEGAHEGKGLGDRFLKHVERTRLLVHLIDLGNWEGRDPLDDHAKINRELASFSPVLHGKPQIVAGNKAELLDEAELEALIGRFAERGVELLPISAATGRGVDDLIKRCLAHLKALDEASPPALIEPDEPPRVYTLEETAEWDIEQDAGGFRVVGPRVRRLGLLRLGTDDALVYLHDQLERLGVFEALAQRGARPGDQIRIGGNVFEFTDQPSPQL